jgi:hypothetical protein
MRSWVVKAAAVAVLSRVPSGDRLAAFARRHVTKSLKLADNVAAGKCERAARHVQYFLEVNALVALPDDFVALELGTGWFPCAPIAASLLGASRVYTLDLNSHLAWPQVEHTLHKVGDLARSHSFAGVRSDRIALIDEAIATGDVSRAFEVLGIRSIVGDARTFVPERPVDLFFSNNTLEHIPEDVLSEIFTNFRRIGSERAVMSHWIDMSDHFMGFDPKIGPFHFLRFTEPAFSWINGAVHYQNRLRHSDFQRLHRDGGWHVALDEPTRGDRADLHRHPLATEFHRYAEDDLLVYEAWMVSAKRPVDNVTLSRASSDALPSSGVTELSWVH